MVVLLLMAAGAARLSPQLRASLSQMDKRTQRHSSGAGRVDPRPSVARSDGILRGRSGPVTPRLVGMGLSARRLLPGLPVHRLPEEVGMAVVPRVLLDHMAQDPSQAGCRSIGPGSTGQAMRA